jgi:phosphoserine phosphatase
MGISMRIAIYDLDRTITAAPTFTPFLVFAARRIAPWRTVLLPVWVAAMAGYRLGFYSRTALKRFGLRLLTGRQDAGRLAMVGRAFAESRIASPGLHAPVMEMAAQDRAAGARVIIATAAFGFYARAFAELLGFDECIATGWDGADIPGGNCYGSAKLARVGEWLEAQGLPADSAVHRFVSDSFADTPLLDRAHEAVFVTTSRQQAARAMAKGWQVLDPRVTP